MTASPYPESVLVSPDWVVDRLDRFESDDPGYRLLEVDVNTAFYDAGHVPGAVKIDWETDLRSEERHDIVGPDELEQLLGACGITDETTVVVYGDDSNWFAAHMYWQLTYYGHPDVRVMDGGRGYWVDHEYPLSTASVSPPTVQYGKPLSPPADPSIRASREDVLDAIGTETVFVDVRLPEEYRGEITAPPGMNETAMRGGHLPGAKNVFWADNVRPDMRFKPPSALRDVYRSHGVEPSDDIIVYCRIGERSSLTWFALSELLGYESVRNYDGSWTEWGNMIGTPIETGE
ncbi:sulfurtransferase [Halobellus rarus]|uniref:Sulfurtransferase n=1 Tax=Halobellus rarus TaxID=1126237 RepID=A0ABD6CJB0_9EURY|nr:sulfurtransferase [Halobellus rarus]